jgi:MFS family permease
MSAAAQRTDRPSTVNVAALAQTAFVSFLLAPPLLGLVAQGFGIRWSFGIALPLVLASLWLSSVLGASKVHNQGTPR